MGKCRDCSRCTRSAVGGLFALPFRFVYLLIFSWNYGLFKKNCPNCGHWLSQHKQGSTASRQGAGSAGLVFKLVGFIAIILLVAGVVSVVLPGLTLPGPQGPVVNSPSDDLAFLEKMGLTVQESNGVTITGVNLPDGTVLGDDPEPGDFIEEVNGAQIATVREIVQLAKDAHRSTVELMVRTGGATGNPSNIELELPGATSTSAMVGVTGKFLEWVPGVIVTSVLPGTPADGQLVVGEIIQKAATRDVRGVNDVEHEFKNASPITVQVIRGGTTTSVSLSQTVIVRVNNHYPLEAIVYDAANLKLGAELARIASGDSEEIEVEVGDTIHVYHVRRTHEDDRTGTKRPDPKYGDPNRTKLVVPITSSTSTVDFPRDR